MEELTGRLYYADTFRESLFKHGEELCGDRVNVIRKPQETTLVLADGMGSGVKANMLATLTSKIISTMISGDADIEDCVETITKTLPVCNERELAYSTFTIIRVRDGGEVYIAEFDGPQVIVIRDGVLDEPDSRMRVIGDKDVRETVFMARPNDMIIAFSDGVINAGIGEIVNYGWERVDVMEYLQRAYYKDITAREMTRTLQDVCEGLYQGEPGDDVTVACVRIIERKTTRVMVGPASDGSKDTEEVQKLLLASGKKIVCGGTTSQIVARVLDEDLIVDTHSKITDVPPTANIRGIDLVTEGVVTLSAVDKMLTQYMEELRHSRRAENPVDFLTKNGASMLLHALVDESSDIVFMIGEASNPAHKTESLGIDLDMKIRVVNSIAEKLIEMGKNVMIERY